MKWQCPQKGDVRYRLRFALFPVVLHGKKDVIWLEMYYEKQTWRTPTYYADHWEVTARVKKKPDDNKNENK